jgi:phosphatidylglycerophosphate synthase
MVAVAEGVVIAASPLGKVKTVFQVIALVMFILKGAPVFVPWSALADAAAWVVMAVALALTVWSAADYFYRARQVIAGPWSGGGPERPVEGRP